MEIKLIHKNNKKGYRRFKLFDLNSKIILINNSNYVIFDFLLNKNIIEKEFNSDILLLKLSKNEKLIGVLLEDNTLIVNLFEDNKINNDFKFVISNPYIFDSFLFSKDSNYLLTFNQYNTAIDIYRLYKSDKKNISLSAPKSNKLIYFFENNYFCYINNIEDVVILKYYDMDWEFLTKFKTYNKNSIQIKWATSSFIIILDYNNIYTYKIFSLNGKLIIKIIFNELYYDFNYFKTYNSDNITLLYDNFKNNLKIIYNLYKDKVFDLNIKQYLKNIIKYKTLNDIIVLYDNGNTIIKTNDYYEINNLNNYLIINKINNYDINEDGQILTVQINDNTVILFNLEEYIIEKIIIINDIINNIIFKFNLNLFIFTNKFLYLFGNNNIISFNIFNTTNKNIKIKFNKINNVLIVLDNNELDIYEIENNNFNDISDLNTLNYNSINKNDTFISQNSNTNLLQSINKNN